MTLLELIKIKRGIYLDEDDLQKFGGISACLNPDGYIVTYDRTTGSRSLLERLILSTKDKIDHKNRNPSDNRKQNLRKSTRSQNAINRPPQRNNTAGYKGVHFNKRTRKYTARIMKDGVSKHLGSFNTAIKAATEYNKEAIKLFGDFAYINKI